jgi:TPR repeat protein
VRCIGRAAVDTRKFQKGLCRERRRGEKELAAGDDHPGEKPGPYEAFSVSGHDFGLQTRLHYNTYVHLHQGVRAFAPPPFHSKPRNGPFPRWTAMGFRFPALICFAAAVFVAAQADAQSVTALAGMQAYNRGDIGTALRLLHEAAVAGDAEAEVNLGYLYARGQGVFEDQKEAFRLYQQSADQGNSEGMNALGYKYLYGTGVAVDPARAVHWFCLAIGNGNPRAMNNLAMMLNTGHYVMQDEAEARALWEQSAKLGHGNSMMNLGMSYLQGHKRDPAKGQEWIRRAAEAGQPDAQRFVLANGYRGRLPPPFIEGAAMIPEPKHTGGHTKICGAYMS